MLRHCTPISHITAVYNPYLEALLLKNNNNRKQQARRTVHACCLGVENIPRPALPYRAARQQSAGAGDVFLRRWQHVSTTLWCTCWRTGTPRERPGVGQRWVKAGHDTFCKCHYSNMCSYRHQEWLIGSVYRSSPAPKQSVLLPNSISCLLQNWQTVFFSRQWTNTHPSLLQPSSKHHLFHSTEKTHTALQCLFWTTILRTS